MWCLAVNSKGTRLAAGCEDGCIRLFDISDDQLEYIRSFEPQKGKEMFINTLKGKLTLFGYRTYLVCRLVS